MDFVFIILVLALGIGIGVVSTRKGRVTTTWRKSWRGEGSRPDRT